jgi:hypothetical protein
MNDNMLIALVSGLIGSLIGGCIAAFGSILAIKRIEMYRRISNLIKLLRNVLVMLDKGVPHPAGVVENDDVDNAVIDLMPFIPMQLRNEFDEVWSTYRYEKNINLKTSPFEYTELSTVASKKLISERLNYLIKMLTGILYYP